MLPALLNHNDDGRIESAIKNARIALLFGETFDNVVATLIDAGYRHHEALHATHAAKIMIESKGKG